MVIGASVPGQHSSPVQLDLGTAKARSQSAWASDDYSVIRTTLQIMGEDLCEALDIRSGQKVLEVAAGNGNASRAAARRWCDVVATDYMPALLERARERATAERFSMAFREADAEAQPFANESFDVVVSTFTSSPCGGFHVSLPVTGALAGGFQDVLRVSAEDVRGPFTIGAKCP